MSKNPDALPHPEAGQEAEELPTDHPSFGDPPPLSRDRAFWSMNATQFFGAFNDNVFKQLVLLLAAGQVAQSGPSDRQGAVMVVFALPFILFSGIAGFYSERNSKKLIIMLSKGFEIVVMAVGLLLLLIFPLVGIKLDSSIGLAGLLTVLFFMGAQSAFFGPGKYGILPEMLRESDLPKANGLILMFSFLAIIGGTALAGPCHDFLVPDSPWVVGLICVGIASIGFFTSSRLRTTPVANAQLQFEWSTLTIPGDVRRYLKKDRPLLQALVVTCGFWMAGGLVLPIVNNLGVQGGLVDPDDPLNSTWTSLLAAGVGIGIALGCLVAGAISRGRADFRLMRIGCIGTVFWLALLSVPSTNGPSLLGYWGSLAALILLGASTGLFIVPLQVFLQSRPPRGQKGRIIATMNLANWIALLLSAALYLGLAPLFIRLQWRSGMFLVTALLMLPIAVFYCPQHDEKKDEQENVQ